MKKLIATDPVWICGLDLIGSDIRNFRWEAQMYGIWQWFRISCATSFNNAPDSRHFPALVQCIPALVLSVCSSCIFTFHCASSSHIFAFHRTSLHFITHLHISLHIFVFHRDLVRIITGASIHCPASSLVHCIPFITIYNYVWHRMIIILLWTLTLPHLHT